MSGLVKAKKYDWKDSNMALFGSDTEKQVKLESAQSEPAWQGSGQEVGLKVWRIVKFEVTEWEEVEYGKFFEGDSYIILNTYKNEDEDKLEHDVHFWIGHYSTQDEYGTAAYKTVELDTFLKDVPVQHRECQGHESSLFKSYFKNITLLKGGADSGFRRVLPEEYVPRLFRVKTDDKNIACVSEIPRKASKVTEDDVFLLDLGETLYQYNGSAASGKEKFRAAQYAEELRNERNGKLEALEGDSTSKHHAFWQSLPDEEDDSDDGDDDGQDEKKLLRVNVESREAEVVKEGEYSADDLKSDDVFIVDSGDNVVVWVGKEASIEERKNAFAYAHNYLSTCNAPWRCISVVAEGQSSKQLDTALAA